MHLCQRACKGKIARHSTPATAIPPTHRPASVQKPRNSLSGPTPPHLALQASARIRLISGSSALWRTCRPSWVHSSSGAAVRLGYVSRPPSELQPPNWWLTSKDGMAQLDGISHSIVAIVNCSGCVLNWSENVAGSSPEVCPDPFMQQEIQQCVRHARTWTWTLPHGG